MADFSHYGFLQNLSLKVVVFVCEEAQSETVFSFQLDLSRRHADDAVARVVVSVNQVLNDIYLAHGAAVRLIYLYFGLDDSVKSLYHGRVLIAFTG